MEKASRFSRGRTRNVYKKLLNLKEKKKHGKDQLFSILLLNEYIWNIKPYQYFLFSVLMHLSCEVIYFFFQAIYTFDKKFFLKYGGHIGCQIFVVINVGNTFMSGDDVVNFLVQYKKKMLPLEMNSKPEYKKMVLECFFLKLWIYATGITVTACGVLHFFNNTYNENAVLFINLYSNISWKFLSGMLSFHYKVCFIVGPYVSVVGSFCLSYFGYYSAVQIRILRGFIAEICQSNMDEKQQYYNQTSQRCIDQSLKICIIIHQTINEDMKVLTAIIYRAIIFYTAGVLFFGAGMMLNIYETKSDISTKMMFASAIVSGVLTTVLYAFLGQLLKDESEELRRALINLPWYNMNAQNKILYIIFLMRSEKPISFDIQLIQIDYLLLVRIFRALYSVSTIITRTIHHQK